MNSKIHALNPNSLAKLRGGGVHVCDWMLSFPHCCS